MRATTLHTSSLSGFASLPGAVKGIENLKRVLAACDQQFTCMYLLSEEKGRAEAALGQCLSSCKMPRPSTSLSVSAPMQLFHALLCMRVR